jgi:hypothetical protein
MFAIVVALSSLEDRNGSDSFDFEMEEKTHCRDRKYILG